MTSGDVVSSHKQSEMLHDEGLSMKKRLFRNTIYRSLTIFSRLLIHFIMFPILVHHFGVEGYGLYLLLSEIVGYFGILDLGVSGAIVKYTAECNAKGDQEELNKLLSSTFFFYLFMGFIASIGMVILSFYVGSIFRISPENLPLARGMILIFAVGTPTAWATRTFHASLGGLQRGDLSTKITVTSTVLYSIGALAIVYSDGGLLNLILWYVLWGSINQIMYVAAIKIFLPSTKIKIEYMKIKNLSKIAKFSSVIFIAQISSLVILHTDQIILGIFVSVKSITFYAVAQRLQSLAFMTKDIMQTSVLPAISEMNARGEDGKIEAYILRGGKYTGAGIICVITILFFYADYFVLYWMGQSEFSVVIPVVRVYLLFWYVFPLWAVATSVLLGKGLFKERVLYDVLVIISNLTLSLILVQRYGIMGVVMGTTIPFLLIVPVVSFFSVRRFKITFWVYLKNILLLPYLALLTLIPFLIISRQYFRPGNILHLVLLSLIGLALYAASFSFFCMGKKERNDIFLLLAEKFKFLSKS